MHEFSGAAWFDFSRAQAPVQLLANVLRTGKASGGSLQRSLEHSVLNQPDAVSEDFSLVR